MNHRMEDLTFLVQPRPAVCARALFVVPGLVRVLFVLQCGLIVSMFFPTGANSVRFYPVAVIDANWKIWQLQWMIEGPDDLAKPWCVASAHTGRPRKKGLVHVNAHICFSSCHAYVHWGSSVP